VSGHSSDSEEQEHSHVYRARPRGRSEGWLRWSNHGAFGRCGVISRNRYRLHETTAVAGNGPGPRSSSGSRSGGQSRRLAGRRRGPQKDKAMVGVPRAHAGRREPDDHCLGAKSDTSCRFWHPNSDLPRREVPGRAWSDRTDDGHAPARTCGQDRHTAAPDSTHHRDRPGRSPMADQTPNPSTRSGSAHGKPWENWTQTPMPVS